MKMNKDEKIILVTGGAGYIGSHVVKRLLKDGYAVTVFDNFSRGYKEPLEILSKYGDLHVVTGDIRKKEDLQKVFLNQRFDAVMHFAALCLVNESMEKPELYFKNNTAGTLNLLEAISEAGVKKLIFSSTCAVYGNNKYLPIDEKHPTFPENPYGESKLMAEKIIGWFGKLHGLNYVILRYFNVCGADSIGEIGDSKKPSELLVQNAVRGVLGIESFRLTCPTVSTADGTPIRDYIDVEDLSQAHLEAYQYLCDGKPSDVFNLGNGRGWSVKEIVDEVKKELGADFPLVKGIERQGEYGEVYANTEKAKTALGFNPQKKLEDSIRSLVKWYQRKPHGYER